MHSKTNKETITTQSGYYIVEIDLPFKENSRTIHSSAEILKIR
jgi:hypothetical protein